MLLENCLEKTKNFIAKYASFFCIVSIILFCYLFIFLNPQNHKFTEGAVYIPFFSTLTSGISSMILNTVMIFAMYFFGRKATGARVYGLISALILLSSTLICYLLKIIPQDTLFMTLTGLSILSAGITLFDIKEENKKYFWYLFYLFAGLSVIQHGCTGIILPLITVLLSFIALGRVKDIIKPLNIIPGAIIYLVITIFWYTAIYKTNIALFINQPDISKFSVPSEFIYYLPVICAGFLPWTFSLVSAVIRGVKSLIKDFKATKSFKQIFSSDTTDRKLLIFTSIYMFSAFLFYAVSGLKSASVILPVLPALSLIAGYYWWGYISDNKFEKGIKHSTIITIVFFIISGFYLFFAPDTVNAILNSENSTNVIANSWIIVLPLITALCLIAKNRPLLFVSHIILMLGISLIIAFC